MRLIYTPAHVREMYGFVMAFIDTMNSISDAVEFIKELLEELFSFGKNANRTGL
jgi:hypothetical protein